MDLLMPTPRNSQFGMLQTVVITKFYFYSMHLPIRLSFLLILTTLCLGYALLVGRYGAKFNIVPKMASESYLLQPKMP
jgi:hypothetical protein